MDFIKCNCNNCSNHLEFDSANAGEVVTCPKCGMETTLYIPTTPPVLKAEKPAPIAMDFIKCTCDHCSNLLEFDSASAGEVVNCSACGMETTLYIPITPPVLKAEKPAPIAMDFIKCTCDHCSNLLGFDSAKAGEIVPCPKCGKETKLYIPTAPTQKTNAPSADSVRLVLCPCCGGNISGKSSFCVKCGEPISKKGFSIGNALIYAAGIIMLLDSTLTRTETIMQQIYREIEFATGILMIGLAVMRNALRKN